MNGNKYSVSIKAPVEAPPGYAAHQLEVGRRQAGNKLYEILYSQKLPAVVDIEEISMPAPQGDMYSMYRPEHELRIEITVTPVQHRHVTIAHADYLSAQQSVQRTEKDKIIMVKKVFLYIVGVAVIIGAILFLASL
jgi:hypothetical protein